MSDHLKPLEVTTSKIGTGAVTEAKIAREAVINSKIKDEAVTGPKIAGNAVTAEKIAGSVVTTAKLADGAVTGQKIALNAVTTDKIANGAVTRDKISDGIINRPFTPPITTAEIGDNQVTGAKLQGLCITTEKIADGVITGAKIAANTITQGDLAANSVGSSELQDDVVTTPKIADSQITNSKLQDASITPGKLDATDIPADGETPTYNQAQGKFEWKPAGGVTRPIAPPIATDEVGELQITDSKITAGAVTVPKVDAVNTPTDGQALTYEQASGRFKYASADGSKITLINPQTVFDETGAGDRSAPLSVATVVPATAIAVLVELHQDGQVPGWAQPSAQIQHPSGGVALTCYITGNSAGNMPMYQDNAGIVPIWASQQIYLVINRVGVSTRVKLTVIGYIE